MQRRMIQCLQLQPIPRFAHKAASVPKPIELKPIEAKPIESTPDGTVTATQKKTSTGSEGAALKGFALGAFCTGMILTTFFGMQMSDKDDKIDSLKSSNRNLDRMHDNLGGVLSQRTTEISILKNQKAILTDTVGQLTKENQEIKQQVEELHHHVFSLGKS